ncbi:SDR family NAD(P)-dependent oxidoreductase, partial [Thermoflavimicrobium dichotomicum]
MTLKKETFLQKISHKNFIVRDHRIHGIRTLPGVTLLDIIYRVSASYLGTQAIELKQVLFKQPVVTSEEFDQHLFLTFEPVDSHWKVTITSQKIKGDQILEEKQDEIMDCLLFLRKQPMVLPKMKVDDFINNATHFWDMDALYGLARQADIYHGVFMKTLGTVYQKENEELMRLHLSEEAERYRNKFYAHPAFLDGSTFAGASFRLSAVQPEALADHVPYIPFMIERFCIHQPLPQVIYTYAKKPDIVTEKLSALPDIISHDVFIFSEKGELLVEFEKLTAKRVREPRLIQKLLDEEGAVSQESIRVESARAVDDGNQHLGMRSEISEGDAKKMILSYLQDEIGSVLGKNPDEIDTQEGFYDLGLDSTQLLRLVKVLEEKVEAQLYPTLLFEYSNITSLADYLYENYRSVFERCETQGHEKEIVETKSASKVMLLEPVWTLQNIGERQETAVTRRHMILLDEGFTDLHSFLLSKMSGVEVVLLDAKQDRDPSRFESKCKQLMGIIQTHLQEKAGSELLIQVLADTGEEGRYTASLGGLLKTAYLENPRIHSQVILLDRHHSLEVHEIMHLLQSEALSHTKGAEEICYKGVPLQRHVRRLKENQFGSESMTSVYKQNGVYVITGGLGGLGFWIAHHLASQANIKLALIGRSRLDQTKEEKLKQLIQKGADVVYLEADVGNKTEIEEAFAAIRERFGSVTGVFHCAGVVKDQFILRKNVSEISEVFRPKVQGLWHVDQCTKDEPLDFFVVFSSISSVTGNLGQADYACANAFMDSFSLHRQELVSTGKRFGKTIAINWPLWSEGGMQIDDELKQMISATSGMEPLPRKLGLQVMDLLLRQNPAQHVVLFGDEEKIRHHLSGSLKVPAAIQVITQHDMVGQDRIDTGDDIAIIGLAGRYPMADSIDELYRNLREGKDCITRIPTDRWKNYPLPYDVEEIYQYGGFLERIDEFDPLFFNISPRQAEIMDPQARLFLQTAWEACEDAGFYHDRTKHHYPSSSKKSVGVFVGVFWNHFELYGAEMTQRGEPMAFGASPSSIPNMVSYCLNFHGPSMAIDTMCSSALTAIHLASESIKKEECHYAIAGGVNLVTHPHRYIILRKAQFLAPDGRCRSFGSGGSGYVPGEGVGAVLLTSLKNAVKEGYHIYGVIKGSALNHVGKTSGITVPDPVAQSEVIGEVLRKTNINPRTISYIEAHGTGTSLGDPIEIQGLKRAFEKWTQDKQYCAIGSSKSNFGHLEAAAGMGGLTKILLQLKYKELFPSLHAEQLNPYIPFEDSPFYVQRHLEKWERPVVEINGKTSVYPRRAGLSSFGANGSNAHLIIEEYVPPKAQQEKISLDKISPVIVPLSAKNEERLKIYAQKVLDFLKGGTKTSWNELLVDLAFTFQVGREPMECRVAFVVETSHDLMQKLEQFIVGEEQIENCFKGTARKGKEGITSIFSGEDLTEAVGKWMAAGRMDKLAELWANGLSIDWEQLYKDTKPRRMSLPTYPFARERYWIPEVEATPAGSTGAAPSAMVPFLHPLLHANTSDFFEQRFTSTFTGEEFFLRDHVVNGQHILPGVCYLEMARAAVGLAVGDGLKGQNGIRLKNVVWVRPVIVKDQPVLVHIGLVPEDNGEIAYQIYGESEEANDATLMFSQGRAEINCVFEDSTLDLVSLREQCNQRTLSSDQCYEIFGALGIEYGPGHRGIEKVFVGNGQVLAKLVLPSSVSDTIEQYALHPSLMDAAFQATVGLLIPNGSVLPSGGNSPALPFEVEEIELVDRCPSSMWAFIRYSSGSKAGDHIQKLDIDLCDDQGKICVRVKKLSMRTMGGEKPGNSKSVSTASAIEPLMETDMLIPVWDTVPLEKGSLLPAQTEKIVVVGGTEENRETIQQLYPQAQFLALDGHETIEKIAERLNDYGWIDHLIWIAPSPSSVSCVDNALIEDQKQGVYLVFRTIKALLRLGYGTRDLGWSVITIQAQPIHPQDPVTATHASIHGLIGSMAKEYPHWKVRLVDLEAHAEWPVADIFMLPADPQGNAWVYREQEWYRQKLLPLQDLESEMTLYQPGGVYVVIGGAGGIGEVWSEYMIQTYQAKIVWIGRREKDSKIQAQLDRLAAFGPSPFYISADATNLQALQRAYEQIKEKYGRINGVIHSAIVLQDKSLAFMEEERFRAGLAAKVDVSVRMAQVFGKEPLDFIMFFSSMVSFIKSPGQSNYSSGCTFKDAFAQQLSRECKCAVKVMNWGYWGSVGIVASKEYQDRMLEAGIGSIEPPEAMESLENLLAGPVNQMALMKRIKDDSRKAEEAVTVYPEEMHFQMRSLQDHISTPRVEIKSLKAEGRGEAQEMDEFLCKLLWGQLQAVGMFTEKRTAPAVLKSQSGLRDLYDRWLEETIAVLVRNGYLAWDEEDLVVTGPTPVDRTALWNAWEEKREAWLKRPELRARLLLVEATLRALPDILTGKQLATDVMFPDSSMHLVEG